MNIKYSTACTVKAALITLALAVALYNVQGQFAVSEPKTKGFRYSMTGEEWLSVHRSNTADDKDQWHPAFTAIVTSYRPVVVKRGNRWEVTFRSNLPDPDLP